MSQGAELFAIREASLAVNFKKVPKDLELTKESYAANVVKTECEVSRIREEIQLMKSEHYATSKDFDNARNEMTSLHNQLESTKTDGGWKK